MSLELPFRALKWLSMRSRFGLIVVPAVLAGCKIVQISTSDESIVSASGDYNCDEDSVCEFGIPNGNPFSETFTAEARYGYAFPGWRGTESYLCTGSAPTCTVDIPGSIMAYDATAYMTVEFYHQPELIDPGTIAVHYDLRSADVTLESGGATIFADDFEGDDDVVFTTGTYPGEQFTISSSPWQKSAKRTVGLIKCAPRQVAPDEDIDGPGKAT